jgi:hypothetical protein
MAAANNKLVCWFCHSYASDYQEYYHLGCDTINLTDMALHPATSSQFPAMLHSEKYFYFCLWYSFMLEAE